MLPSWVEENADSVNTGSEIADQIICVMLQTSMFVSGTIGFFLDNTLPGIKGSPIALLRVVSRGIGLAFLFRDLNLWHSAVQPKKTSGYPL